MDQTIYDVIRTRAEQQPDAVAILAIDQPAISYAELRGQVEAMAERLNELGVRRNDRVAIFLPNGPRAATAFLSVSSVATSAPLNPASRDAELKSYLRSLQPRALVTQIGLPSPATGIAREQGIPVIELPAQMELQTREPACAESGDRDRIFAQLEDVALVLPTSGTTSKPKMVPLTHVNVCASARNTARSLELSEKDLCLNVMPLFHVHGLIGALFSSLISGGSVVCAPGFQPDAFCEWMETFQPTWYTAVPTIHQAILARLESSNSSPARSSLRFARSCSAPLPPQVAAALEEMLKVPIIEAYGMTEASHQVTSNPLPPRRHKAGAVGIGAGPEVAIMNGDGDLLPAGEPGEIVIRGDNVMSGYENNPLANEAAFTRGWFRTGDLGTFDPDGYLTIIGRSKEIINRGGEKIAPREIEEVLLDHPAVVQVAAFSVPHPKLGEDLAAAVVLRHQAAATEGELRQFVFNRLVDHKVPRQIIMVDEIPRGPTGKVQRMALSEALKSELRLGFVPPVNRIEEAIAAVWAEELRLEQVGRLDNFFALGGDSLAAVSLLLSLEKQFGQPFPLDILFLAPTVKELASVIEGGRSLPQSTLLPLQPSGDKPPLFCVPGHGGKAFVFSGLARYLGPEQPLYAFRFPDVAAEDDFVANAMIHELASTFIEATRSIQPQGPYLLCGYCFGARVAFDMAQQLTGQGQEVGLVAVIEAYLPGSLHISPQRQVGYHLHMLGHLTSRQRMEYLVGRGTKHLLRTARVLASSVGCKSRPDEAGLPRPQGLYPGRITLFRAQYHDKCRGEDCNCDPLMGWGSLAKETVTHRVPGDKSTIYREPNVRVLAEQLSCCIEEASRSLSLRP